MSQETVHVNNDFKRCVIDIETKGFLNDWLDFSTLPYRFKPDFRVWMVVLRCVETNKVKILTGNELTKEGLRNALRNTKELIGHFITKYDLPVLQIAGLLDYTVAYPGQISTVFGQKCLITDTLIWSKLFNPDRLGGHSLEAWGLRFNHKKGDFSDFSKYSAEMLEYCIQDTSVNRLLYLRIRQERSESEKNPAVRWKDAYEMELKNSDLSLRQELFGFALDTELAAKCLVELDGLMLDLSTIVNPHIPPCPLNKGDLKDFIAPKKQFKANGEFSELLKKFAEKHSATLEGKSFVYKGKALPLPLQGPLESTREADIDDLAHLKGHLIDLGWYPTEWSERDITVDSKKAKKSIQKLQESIDKYVEQTFSCAYQPFRLEILKCNGNANMLKAQLMQKAQDGKPLKVPTSPKISVGLEKEICPNLKALGEKATFVKSVAEYYTYKHRRNSIAGGTLDEDGEPITGFLSNPRPDKRISTPADTLGAASFRYKHSKVCNIPRVTSLYGKNMRALFGPGKGLWQFGYDFASLEARTQGHFCYDGTDGIQAAATLLAEKPNDIHSLNAKRLGIGRQDAKSFSFACIFGAQAAKLAKMLNITIEKAKELYEQYWEANPALKEFKDQLESEWQQHEKTWIAGCDGRQLQSRSKHSLVNLAVQSTGAIYVKYVVVESSRLMEELGILANPLTDTADCAKVWQMIVYHDEVQYAVHPSLMKAKVFKTEEEAKAARTETSSAIGHSDKGFYVAYQTQPVECIRQAMQTTAEKLKMKVPMGIEWNIGDSWATTH